MRIQVPARRLTVHLSDTDLWHHKPLYHEIVRRAHHAGLIGATVIRGMEGFGSSGHIHTTRILSLADNLPIMVIIIDTEPKIRDFLSHLDDITTECLVTIESLDTIRYIADQERQVG